MQPMRRPKMDIFESVAEARPEDLRAARVRSNLEDSEVPKATKRLKKSHRVTATDRTAKESLRIGKNGAKMEPQRRQLPDSPARRRSYPRLLTPGPSEKDETPPADSDTAIDYDPPITRSQHKKSHASNHGSQSEGDVFEFPEDGTYLREVENDIATPLLHEENSISRSPDDIPVRVLRDFFVFDPSTLEFVSLSCLWEGDGPCEAFGVASAEAEDDEQDDRDFEADDGIFFRTSTILTCSLDIHQDSIWVKTQYAWYILKTPATIYQPLFLPFYSREMLLRIVLRGILDDFDMPREVLLRDLAKSSARDPVLGRCWNQDDFSHCRHTLQELTEVVTTFPGINWEEIKNAPLLSLLLDSFDSDEDMSDAWEENSAVPSAPQLPRRTFHGSVPTRKRKRKTKVKTVETTITPTIHALVSPYFETEFTVVGKRPSFLNEEMLAREQPQDLSTVNVTYKPGDFVMVNEGDFDDESGIRFAQILFFDQRRKNFHARWFIHGSKTILEELAHGQELFLSVADGCQDVSVDCLVSKCNVVRISLADHSRQKWPAKDSYFFSSAWDRKHPAGFVQVIDEQVQVLSSHLCTTCEARDASISQFKSKFSSIIRSKEYHQYDFVCYEATSPGQLTCNIGQIITFINSDDEVKIRVHTLGRERDRKKPGSFAEPALFLTTVQETVNARSVIRPCQVLHISEYELKDATWLDRHPDCFYVMSQAASLSSPLTPLPSTSFEKCQICTQKEYERDALELQCQAKPLRAFDPFAGTGGFGLGLAQGCSMATCLGVELNGSAAETMRRNFPPETTVLTADANQVLRDVIKGRETRLARGKIDLLYSGPPCQNDSALNRHKTDKKRPAFTTLSYVDHLRPQFFIMESVPGFLQWKVLKDSPNEIKAGDLKLVLKSLHFLGYNIVGRLMHGRSYGVPQTRDRFFIVATLPEWGQYHPPEATHAFSKVHQPKTQTHRLGQGLKLTTAVGSGRALHEVVTIAEALSDLPLFDWTSPKELTQQQKEEADARAKIIPTLPCPLDDIWGITDADFAYECPARNAFQHRARRDLVFCAKPQFQYFTKHFPAYQVENICDVPFSLGADYRHLDQKNREWCLRDPASSKAMGGYQAGAYSRLNPDGYFHTIVTQVGPVAKQSSVLHPVCKRILTVRELARAQGFPDDFVFYSETDKIDDYHKQIGNSVPFSVSAALGRSIQDMVFKKWLAEREDGDGDEDE